MKGKIIVILIVLAILLLSVFINRYEYKILSQESRRIRILIVERTGIDLVNYPLRIVITSSNFTDWSSLRTDGSDIYFTDINGNPLYYWIESFDYNNQIAILWVKIPSLSAGSTMYIYMWYGGTNPYSAYRGMTKVATLFTSFENGVVPSWISVSTGVVSSAGAVQVSDAYDGSYQFQNTAYGGTTSVSDALLWQITISLPFRANRVRLIYYERGGYYQYYWHPHTYKNNVLYQDYYNVYTVQSTWTQRDFTIASSSGVNDITSVGISYNKEHASSLRYIPWVAIDYLFVFAFVDPAPIVTIITSETITFTSTITSTETIPITITSTTTIISTITETLTETTTYTTTYVTTIPTTITTYTTVTNTITTTYTTTYTTIVPTTITETDTYTTTIVTTYTTVIPTTITSTYISLVPTTITTTTEIPVTITATPTVTLADIAQVLTAVGLIGAVLVGAFKGKKTLAKSEYFEKERKE